MKPEDSAIYGEVNCAITGSVELLIPEDDVESWKKYMVSPYARSEEDLECADACFKDAIELYQARLNALIISRLAFKTAWSQLAHFR